MSPKQVTLSDLKHLIRGRPCLVVGTSVTTKLTFAEIQSHIREVLSGSRKPATAIPETTSISELLDELSNSDQKQYSSIRAELIQFLDQLVPSPICSYIAKARWSALVSLCYDMCLEDAFRTHFNSQPSPWTLTVVATPFTIPRRSQTLPAYKMFGSLRSNDPAATLALSRSEQLLRKQVWTAMLKTLRDVCRDSPMLFLGTSTDQDAVQNLLSAIFADQPPFPSRLIFLRNDPCPSSAVISRLSASRSELIEVGADVKDVIQALQSAVPEQMPLALRHTPPAKGLYGRLSAAAHLVDVVPRDPPASPLSGRRQEVIDSLFQPLAVDWAPFQYDLDFHRDQSDEVVSLAERLVGESDRDLSCIVIRGEAGVGKSTLAKRSALNLAKTGNLVLWCKRLPVETPNPYRELARTLKIAKGDNQLPKPPIIFCDDPWALRISLGDLISPFEYEGVNAIFIIVVRNSDFATHGANLRLPVIPVGDIEVSFELSERELVQIPRFLVGIGVAKDEGEGERNLTNIKSRNSRDVLCSLWYLIPDTHAELTRSLQDEYFRLGGGSEIAAAVAGVVAERSSVARRAYEFVSVTSGLDVGLPVEVLVRAVKVNYEEWLSLCQRGRPLWGLLYPTENVDSETIVYFTRNEIVTQVLLRQLNGGVGHAGEYRVLTELIAACDSAAPAYREFLIDVLVKRHRALAERFSAQEGRHLFELALTIFPVPDRTISHHYGKWITDVINDPTEGYTLLSKALETPEYQFATQEEPIEHIHTSMAAAVVKRVKRGLQDRESGLALIKRHLREGSSPSFFNLHTVHVQVNALLSLQSGEDLVSLESFAEAARSVERALQLSGSRGRVQKRFLRDIEVMDDLKRRLIEALEPFDGLRDKAMSLFDNSGKQIFLEAAARKGLLEASESDKGSHYYGVYQFIKRCAVAVAKKGQQLSAGLRSVRVDLHVRWRLQHFGGTVDWSEFLGDLVAIQETAGYRDEPLVLFYTAVTYFQLGKVSDGLAVFSRIRSIYQSHSLLSQTRMFLRDEAGNPRQLQGVLSGVPSRRYIRADELKYDVPVRNFQPPSDYRTGATIRFWLAFSLNGPLAAFRLPSEDDVLLP